jgi:ferrochelatase
MNQIYDALLVVSFGGPEREEDVLPFLENVLRGKNVPRERMLEVAEHYYHLGGKSPINSQNRALIAELEDELSVYGVDLPVYRGNRNWHPMLADTLRRMQADGVRNALAFATSAFGSYSGCRQYLEDIDRAREAVGPGAPEVHKLPPFHNRPGFLAAMADRVRTALGAIPVERRASAPLLYTAHSIPLSMAESSPYVAQLQESCGLVSKAVGHPGSLVYQSRSGPPTQPWLEPDVCDRIRQLHAGGGLTDLVLAPIGFLSDHMEVLYDLDTEAANLCRELGVNMVRAGTVGVHPAFLVMIREMIVEASAGCAICPAECCPAPRRPPAQIRGGNVTTIARAPLEPEPR